jgi:hypothetical protein
VGPNLTTLKHLSQSKKIELADLVKDRSSSQFWGKLGRNSNPTYVQIRHDLPLCTGLLYSFLSFSQAFNNISIRCFFFGEKLLVLIIGLD